jgi:hypothetical protein
VIGSAHFVFFLLSELTFGVISDAVHSRPNKLVLGPNDRPAAAIGGGARM